MPTTPITVNTVPGESSAVLTWTPVVVANSHTMLNDGETVLAVYNPDAADTLTVTVAGVPCSHGRTANIVAAVAPSTSRLIGPFPKELFNDANGNVNITQVEAPGAVDGALYAAIRDRF